MMNQTKIFAAVIAVIGWMALTAQFAISVQLFSNQGGTVLDAAWRYFGYFTIITNMLVAVAMTRVALGYWPASAPSALTGVVFTIAIVGFVYHFILKAHVPSLEAGPWIVDRTLHYLIPGLSAVFWLICVPKSNLTFADPFRWILIPVLYFAYAIARGIFDGWYPYFFIDVNQLGYAVVFRNAIAMTAIVLMCGLALVAIVRAVESRS
jgi:hypothetical protein